MKRNNKKGFTIVELVIVIAVIAILSAVLIPTFGGVIENAQNSARDQEAKNALTSYLADATAEELGNGINGYIKIDTYYYIVTNSNIDLDGEDASLSDDTLKHLNCADVDTDHNCDVCDRVLSQCTDADNDGKCDVCDAETDNG